MNIAIDIRPLMVPVRTGVGEYTFELLDALFAQKSDHHFFLYYNASQDVSTYIPDWKYDHVHFVPSRWPNKVLNGLQALFQFPKLDQFFLKQYSIDIFFSPNLGFTALSKQVKHVLTIHDLSFELFPNCYSYKRRLWHSMVHPKGQCARADVILVPSENTKRDVVEVFGVPEEKVHVVYPGLSSLFTAVSHQLSAISASKRLMKYNIPDRYMLYVGTIEPRKNIEGIIAGYKQYQTMTGNYPALVVAGPKGWNCDHIMELLANTKNVHYIGYVAAEDKPLLYKKAELVLFPSLYEGFGFPVLEAMATGTPVITSNRSSLVEVAANACYLVNSMNTTEIAIGMQRILEETALRDLFVQRGLEQCKLFSWQKAAAQFLSIVDSL